MLSHTTTGQDLKHIGLANIFRDPYNSSHPVGWATSTRMRVRNNEIITKLENHNPDKRTDKVRVAKDLGKQKKEMDKYKNNEYYRNKCGPTDSLPFTSES